MRHLTGALAFHRCGVLSLGERPQNIELHYDSTRPFVLPDTFAFYRQIIAEYWQRESPDLKDFPSIVHVDRIEVKPGRISIWCRPTSYFEFLHSNYSLTVLLKGRLTLQDLYRQDVFGMFEAVVLDKGIQYFFPAYGNTLGINVAVVSGDEKLIVFKRGVAASLAREKNTLSLIGTQTKRHQERFLLHGIPSPFISAQQGILDEMGERVAMSCSNPICLGMGFHNVFMHLETHYMVRSVLSARQIISAWRRAKQRDPRQAGIFAIDLKAPGPLLASVCDPNQHWSPQHASCALYALAQKFRQEVLDTGFPL